ncbi:MAG: LysM peptidoglycan-binding domain-containing protein [Bacteroidetes bacterium]|nr:LysM peptidoglycan-binding domain-containing protein [Bacteroidota bacterium]
MLNSFQHLAFSQTELKDSSGIIFSDDPIASMLDSLSHLKIFEKTALQIHPNKYHFPLDSVPNYSDSVYAMRLAKLDAESPFYLIYNNAVRSYIELYAVRKRGLVERVLGMSQLYFPMIEEILDKHKMPLELKYLAIVESALNPSARSRCGAMGLWQFMYGTGKIQGLKISSYMDERCDPYKSTEAACEYLQFLYDMFGDWQMVLAAYNSGPGNVSKAIRRSGGKTTYWEIRPYLPRETQGYVPAFIAVNYVMTHAEEHNLYPAMPRLTAADVDTLNIKQELSFQQISRILDIPVEDIQYLNPCYKRCTVPSSEGECYSLCLPITKIGMFIANEDKIYEYAKKDSLMQTLAIQQIVKTYVVRKGETMSRVARKFGCTPEDIQAWNHLRYPKLHSGQALTIYIPVKGNSSVASVKTTSAENSSAAKKVETKTSADTTSVAASANQKFRIVTVRKGDSLWNIAQENGVTLEQLKQWNNIPEGKIIPGQKLKILSSQ